MIDIGAHRLAVERWRQPSHGNLRRTGGKEFDLNSVFCTCRITKLCVAGALD
jgi:hypothetical protein